MAFLQGLWPLSGTTWFDSLRSRDAGPHHSPCLGDFQLLFSALTLPRAGLQLLPHRLHCLRPVLAVLLRLGRLPESKLFIRSNRQALSQFEAFPDQWCLIRPRCLNQAPIWFQLAKMRVAVRVAFTVAAGFIKLP
jgi:hypothetical protein